MKELALGSHAPDFTLTDEKGAPFQLSEFLGKKNIVLIFYPGNFTPGCNVQLCAIRDDWTKFTSTNTLVVGINHAEATSHLAYTKKFTFPFQLLTDKGKKVSKLYGAIRSLFGISVIRRSVIAIDTRGIIVYLRRGMPKNTDILKVLTSLT